MGGAGGGGGGQVTEEMEDYRSVFARLSRRNGNLVYFEHE